MIRQSVRPCRADGYLYLGNNKSASSTIKFALWKHAFQKGHVDHMPKGRELHSRGFWDESYDLEKLQDNALVFSFVRNPFGRALSCYLDKIAKLNPIRDRFCEQYGLSTSEDISFERYLTALTRSRGFEDNPHWRPQADNLLVGGVKFGFLGRLENFQEDFRFVCERLGLEMVVETRQHHATNAGVKSVQTFTPQTVQLVLDKYGEDFAVFGYPTDVEASKAAMPRPLSPPIDKTTALVVRAFGHEQIGDRESGRCLRKAARLSPDEPFVAAARIEMLIARKLRSQARAVLSEANEKWSGAPALRKSNRIVERWRTRASQG